MRVQGASGVAGPASWAFADPFRIGRGAQCEIRVDSGLVSREHAEVTFEQGRWVVRDLGSSNGLYVSGVRTEVVPLEGEVEVQLGRSGPALRFSVQAASGSAALPAPRREPPQRDRPEPSSEEGRTELTPMQAERIEPPTAKVEQTPPATTDRQDVPAVPPPAAGSMTQFFAHYTPGENEVMDQMREAYEVSKKKHKKKYTGVIAAVVGLLVVALGYGVYQYFDNRQLQGAVNEMFYMMKEQDLEMAQVRKVIEEEGGASMRERLAQIEAKRRADADRYDGLVSELGLYRRLDEEEQLIYRVARVFNESQLEIPATFIREVKETIQRQWVTPGGRRTFTDALDRARRNDFIPFIAQAMQEHGLPPQFFYLAMQESLFKVDALGPYSHPRFGRAKGMWQFIPETGRAYGLFIPNLDENADRVVRDDERHDFQKSTQAAAAYLQDIYTTLAQASGLLAMASYNWGEGRVVRRLGQLAGLSGIDEEAVPETPRARTYWYFLNNYEAQMPDQTKEYVLKIFAAAVVGEDPRRYGFDFDNPLAPYLEAAPADAP